MLHEGDTYLGSTVTDLDFGGSIYDDFSGLNDVGQVAYSFRLADDRRGIALAGQPLPVVLGS